MSTPRAPALPRAPFTRPACLSESISAQCSLACEQMSSLLHYLDKVATRGDLRESLSLRRRFFRAFTIAVFAERDGDFRLLSTSRGRAFARVCRGNGKRMAARVGESRAVRAGPRPRDDSRH